MTHQSSRKAYVPIVGHDMRLAGTGVGVTDSLRLMHGMGGRAIQITLGGPGSRTVREISYGDAETTVQIMKHGYYVVVHGKYIYNFCRPSGSIKWQHKLLLAEMVEANKIGADVIIHQGKNVKELGFTKEQAHETFVSNLVIVLGEASKLGLENHIILENSARQGTECGYSLDDLYDIHQRIPIAYQKRIRYCIDLCHIFVAGELDVRNGAATRRWFDRFDELIGFQKLACIHFNDSNTEFNGANDNHGSIGKGYIGKRSTSGFKYVCKLAYEHRIPLILETSSEYIHSELQQLKEWCLL
jgi:deoxyribonuclease-4